MTPQEPKASVDSHLQCSASRLDGDFPASIVKSPTLPKLDLTLTLGLLYLPKRDRLSLLMYLDRAS